MKSYNDEIAQMFIKAMEEGTAPWQRPWSSSALSPKNGITGHEYRGMNAILLLIAPHDDPRYCTFKQARDAGYTIKKGGKGHLIKYCCFLSNEDEENDEEEKGIFMQKYFYVFNFEDIEGVPTFEIPEEKKEFNTIIKCEEVLRNFDVQIEESKIGNEAFYNRSADKIVIPDRHRFVDELAFYHTAFHEMAHATGATKRLNRNCGIFGSETYAFEELIAEITSFLVGRALGCGSTPKKESVSYVASWIKQLKQDNRLIFKACKLAEQACNRILNPTEGK